MSTADVSGAPAAGVPIICPDCGAQVAPALLSCPACHRLVHADRLNELAAEARRFEAGGDLPAALARWREAMDLLPADSQQYAAVAGRVSAMTRRLDAAGVAVTPRPQSPGAKRGVWGAIVAIVVAVLGKAKFLLAGLGKAATFWSMLLSIGVYWTVWGWRFALGLALSIYVHEMGHVAMLRRYGMRATAPMFVPGLGAYIRLKQHPADSREDAMIGLAGPVWGTAASIVAWGTGLATGIAIFTAIGKVNAWVNLFNLTPFGSLDGGRGFRALSRPQRFAAVAGVAAAYWWSGDGLLLLVGVVGLFRALGEPGDPKGDAGTLARYLGLVGVLTALTMMHVAVPD